MTFNQINYFLAVAKHLSFTRAAASRFITQSTLSKSISALETELGTSLIERDYHNVRLTQAGELLYKEMSVEMESINDIITRVQLANRSGNRRFTIGLLDGQGLFPNVTHAMRMLVDVNQDEGVELKIERKSHQELLDDLAAGKLDIVQMTLPNKAMISQELDSFTLADVGMVLVARDDHPVWKNETIDVCSLSGQELIVPENRNFEIDRVLEKIAGLGVRPKLKQIPDTETLTFMLDAGIGVLVCNELHVTYSSLKAKTWRAAHLDTLPRSEVLLLWEKENKSGVVERFLEYVQNAPHGAPAMWTPREVNPDNKKLGRPGC